ncbi:hypothetical protein F0562_011717 [Nyssa sinensis]|uniref:MBD domain-containing protein n=1 Tax=Nyssa sinensis TaxID=561372 RepID=A0A5J4ZRS8_9ASTE|nr:hypothetical protein F0562_011717 [Nyssa sinensis]
MVAGKSPDWLPSGWTVQVKVNNGRKVRCFSNRKTGHKFHSKNDVIHYIKTGHVRTTQPINKNNKRHSKNKSMPLAVKTNEFPEWLPSGWTMEVKTRRSGSQFGKKYKCYIDPVTRCKFYSKPEVFQYLKTLKRNGCTSKQKKIATGSVSNVAVERVTPDGLPTGWIKEIKIQKKVNGIRKDPYYTDPVSGYTFFSKKDALRYLETGDINSCATKPKKRGVNDVESMKEEISPQSSGKGHKLRHHTTRRQIFAGKGSCVTSSLVASCAQGSKEGRCKIVSVDAIGTSTPKADVLEGKHLLNNLVEKCAEAKESPEPSNSILPKTKGSKRKQGEHVLAEIGQVSSPATNIQQEAKLVENGMEKLSNGTAQTDSRKCKNEKAFSLPCRSSKRLAGLNPELVANSGLSERALRAATRKSGESEANPSLGLALDGVADSALQQLDAEPETEFSHHASGDIEAPLDVEPSNKSENSLGAQDLPVEQPGRWETEKKDENPESQLLSPFGDSWSDPCLEFAFKTLTGEIQVEDYLPIQDNFQQPFGPSHTWRDGCSALPDFGLNISSQNNVSSHFDAFEKPVCMQQLQTNPTLLPPGNVSLPSCSSGGPQQPGLDLNKEYQAKVN